MEAALLHEPFTGVPTDVEGPFDTSSPNVGQGSVLEQAVQLSGLLDGTGYRVRMRTTTRSPFFPRSRWMTPEAHASGDHDVWTQGELVGVPAPGGPGATLALAVTPNPA